MRGCTNIIYTDIRVGRMTVKNIVLDDIPPVYALPDGSIVGAKSYYAPREKTRYIARPAYVRVGGLEGTQQSVTRDWLNATVSPRRAKKSELRGLDKSRAPMYASPAIIEDAVYIDIASAYESIYSIIGWDVDYVRGSYFAGGRDGLIYPYPQLKIGRSYVISGAYPRSRIIQVWGRSPHVRETLNPLSNPSLVASTLDVLAAIARFAVSIFGGVYYNVDGAIMPRDYAPLYTDFLRSLGLTAKIKYQGRAWISNLTNWSIGERVVRLGNDGNIQGGDWIRVTDDEASWVLEGYLDVLKGRG